MVLLAKDSVFVNDVVKEQLKSTAWWKFCVAASCTGAAGMSGGLADVLVVNSSLFQHMLLLWRF